MSLPRTPYQLDQFVKHSRHRTLNHDDGTASEGTELIVQTVPADSNVEISVQVPTAFDGTTPSMQLFAQMTDGTFMVTLGDANACSIDHATSATTVRKFYYAPTTDCDILAYYARPASGQTTGRAVIVVDHTSDPSNDSVLGGDTLT